jgi:hypothetical protein
LANLSLTPEKGGETSIGTSRFPLNKLLKQFIIKIVTKMRKIFHFHLITFLLFCPFLLWAQEFNLSGVVVDNTGETLPGVSIAVKGTTRGVITDMNGAFQLKVSKGETLVFSYVGYDEQQILITNQKILNIRMEPTTMGLDEVVVVGYGTQSKRTVTSAISKVDGETLKATPINTVGEGLKGKIAGVRVYNENNTPGAEATFFDSWWFIYQSE